VRLAGSGIEHRHRRLVGVKYRLLQQFGFHRIDQRLQLHTAASDPLR
jgi:hypothetical protein